MLLEARYIKLYVKDRLLLDAERVLIEKHDRIGLVGRNGSGKTTLLETLAGTKAPDEGTVTAYVSCELLPQLKRTDTTKSGGELTQQYLIEALSKSPELLLLDEPTTHLDTNHIEWLEKKLAGWPGAFVVVSHDRAFLDALCTTIWELDGGQLNVYTGNYSDYAAQKQLEREQHQLAYEQYEQKKRQLEEALKLKERKAERATKAPKNVSASEAKITGAKPYFAKKQKKLHQAAKAIETRLEKLEKVEKLREEPPIRMNLPNESAFKGRIVLRAQDISGQIGNRTLWEKVSFHIRGGDKIVLIGPNGCGKTTLVKKILRGEAGITLSPSLKIGYFSQDLTILQPEKSILDNVRSTSSQDETLIRTVLARLHFFRDDVHKPVSVLSGGERVKTALAKIFVSDINTLVLDEPTNFLDIAAVEALESLLRQYEGTIIFVTHDRRFAENVATRIMHFDQGRVGIFEGTYTEYRESLRQADIGPVSNSDREQERLVLETRISEVLGRLSLMPSEELEAEFHRLVAERKKLESKQ